MVPPKLRVHHLHRPRTSRSKQPSPTIHLRRRPSPLQLQELPSWILKKNPHSSTTMVQGGVDLDSSCQIHSFPSCLLKTLQARPKHDKRHLKTYVCLTLPICDEGKKKGFKLYFNEDMHSRKCNALKFWLLKIDVWCISCIIWLLD